MFLQTALKVCLALQKEARFSTSTAGPNMRLNKDLQVKYGRIMGNYNHVIGNW